jgi:NitT/TauT family transport system substrate-binding protein
MTRRQSLVVATTIAGCRSRDSKGHVRMVTAGSAATLGYLPHVLAQQLGFYRQQSLSLEVESVAGGSRGLRSLVGGSADVVVGFFDHPVRITALDRKVQAFVVLARYPGNVVVTSVRASKRIRKVTDLRGATVGIPDQGSQAHLFLNYLLIRHGLSPDDVRMAAVGLQTAGVAAVEQGKIDAWAGFDPGITRYLRRNPKAVILADARTEDGVEQCAGAREYAGAVLYSTAAWLDRNAQAARRLVRAIQQGLQWVHHHGAEQIAQQVPVSFYGDDREAYVQALENSKEMYSPDGRMTHDSASTVYRVLAASMDAVRTARFDISDTYTNRLVEEDVPR